MDQQFIMARAMIACLPLAIAYTVFASQGWRLALPTQAHPAHTQCAHPHCPQHPAVRGAPLPVCLASQQDGPSGAAISLVLAGVLGYLLLGLGRARAVDPPLPHHGPNAVPRPFYLPGHTTVLPPIRPLRLRYSPDWYCCCKAEALPACQCDRSHE